MNNETMGSCAISEFTAGFGWLLAVPLTGFAVSEELRMISIVFLIQEVPWSCLEGFTISLVFSQVIKLFNDLFAMN
jgi:hypothetical protein